MTLRKIYNDSSVWHTVAVTCGAQKTTRGFSLMEVIIVIAIVAVVASFGSAFSLNSISRSNLISERDLLVSLLTQARAQALANVHESPHSVHIDTERYVLYEGTSYSFGNPTNRVVPKVSQATITGVATVTFAQLTADVASAGTVTIAGGVESYDIEINSSGRINW